MTSNFWAEFCGIRKFLMCNLEPRNMPAECSYVSLTSMENISEEESQSELSFRAPPREQDSSPPMRNKPRRKSSFKALRRKSEEFFKRRSPACTVGLDDGLGPYDTRQRAKSHTHLSSKHLSLNTSSDEDSPFVRRKWRSFESSRIPYTSSRISMASLNNGQHHKRISQVGPNQSQIKVHKFYIQH